jgi:hypothetical protein
MTEKTIKAEYITSRCTQEDKDKIAIVATSLYCTPAALVRKCTMEFVDSYLKQHKKKD